MPTRELRRYTMRPGLFDAFLEWYLGGVPQARAAYGFTVEWCAIDREHGEFLWLVRHEGDEAAFHAAVEAHKADPDWIVYRAGMPEAIERIDKSFVEVVVPSP